MTPDSPEFGLIWTALPTRIPVGWRPLDRENTDEPGVPVGPTGGAYRRPCVNGAVRAAAGFDRARR
jgi:hypothetical protein